MVGVTDQGNLVTDILAAQLRHVPREASQVTVTCDEHVTNGIFDAGHNEPPMTLLALIGPGGQLELEIVGDSARLMLGVTKGTKVVVRW